MSDDDWHPGYPNWFDKINFLVDFFIDPCDAPITVYVESLKPALLDFLISYYQADLTNININLFRWSFRIPKPKGGRKGRHGNKSNKPKGPGFLRGILTFDIDQFISSKIALFQRLPKQKATFGIATLWAIEGVIERINFWLFIFEIALDFFFAWSSLIKKSVYCQAQGDNVLLAEGGAQTLTGVFGWVGLLMPNIRKIRGHITWNFASGGYFGATGHVMIKSDVTANDEFFHAHGCGLRVTIHNFNGHSHTVSRSIDLEPLASGSLTVGANLVYGDTFVVEHSVASGVATFSNNMVEAHGKNRKTS